jgi:hypothetical protein
VRAGEGQKEAGNMHTILLGASLSRTCVYVYGGQIKRWLEKSASPSDVCTKS